MTVDTKMPAVMNYDVFNRDTYEWLLNVPIRPTGGNQELLPEHSLLPPSPTLTMIAKTPLR